MSSHNEATPQRYNIETSQAFIEKLKTLQAELHEGIGRRSLKLKTDMNNATSMVDNLAEFLQGTSYDRQLFDTILKIRSASQAVAGLLVGFGSAQKAQQGLKALTDISSNHADATVEQKAVAAFLEGNEEFLKISDQVAKDAKKSGVQLAAEGDKKQGGGITYGGGYSSLNAVRDPSLKNHGLGSESSAD